MQQVPPGFGIGHAVRSKIEKARYAFTLVELLVVIGIIVVLMALMGPALNSLKTSNELTSAAFEIAGVLEQAKSYAIAHNTFVFVGFSEVDSSKDASVTPQVTPSTGKIGGRVVVAAVAAKDGTRGYDPRNTPLANPAWTNYNKGANLVAISKLYKYENLHLADMLIIPATGGLKRPYPYRQSFVIGSVTGTMNTDQPTDLPVCCVTPFEWPLGKDLTKGQYTFRQVIYFDSNGVPRIQYSKSISYSDVPIEIGLQETHGTSATPKPGTSIGNVAVVQVDVPSGEAHIYRP